MGHCNIINQGTTFLPFSGEKKKVTGALHSTISKEVASVWTNNFVLACLEDADIH